MLASAHQFPSDRGVGTAVEAGPLNKEVAQNALGERCQASITIAGKRVYIRTGNNLHCIGGK